MLKIISFMCILPTSFFESHLITVCAVPWSHSVASAALLMQDFVVSRAPGLEGACWLWDWGWGASSGTGLGGCWLRDWRGLLVPGLGWGGVGSGTREGVLAPGLERGC